MPPITARTRRLFQQRLLAWFRTAKRDLPWRGTSDPYRIWLSEIMLQQTRVSAAIPYYERFLARLPSIGDLAAASEAEVLRLWSGLGYYSRARNLRLAAQAIVARHGGAFPRALEDTLALPGIGLYTAAAILSIAFGENLAVLDGNVARVLARLGAVRGDLREPARWKALQQRADELLARNGPGSFNEAMMELGATICTPVAPKCLLCPVAEFCEARRTGLAGALPEKRRKRATVDVRLAAAVLTDGLGRTLLLPPAKAGAGEDGDLRTLFSKMPHFPAVCVSRDSTRELAGSINSLSRALGRVKLEPLAQVHHAVTFRRIIVEPFLVRVRELPRLPEAHITTIEALASKGHHPVPISNLTRKIAQAAERDALLTEPHERASLALQDA